MEPQSVHMWRQTDCLSFTKNYCEEDRGFFEPSIHHIGKPGTGKTVSDFPLIYFTMGRLWRITGQQEWIYRGFVLLLYLTAIFLVHRTLLNALKDPVYSVLLPLFLFTSPVLVYYSNNFLINLPAFSLVLIAWHFFYRYYKSETIRYLWLAMAFFALAGIFKASALLSFFALFGVFFLELTNLVHFKEKGRIFSQIKKAALPFVLVIILVAAWMTFVIQYNNTNNRSYFLTGILPIWDFTKPEIMVKFREIANHWIFLNYPGIFQALIVVFWFIMMALPKKNDRLLYFLNLVMAIGVVMFLLLFYQVIAGHDYYWIDLFILLFFTLFSFVFFLKRNLPAFFKWGKIAFAILLIYNAIYCQRIIYDRYHGDPNNYYNEWLKDFSSAKPYLRSLGIERTDYVISIPEGTINASLYMMDQKGWTTYGSNFEEVNFYYSRIARGAKYLLVSDSTFLRKDYLQPFITNKIGQHKSISIYDLRNIEVPVLPE